MWRPRNGLGADRDTRLLAFLVHMGSAGLSSFRFGLANEVGEAVRVVVFTANPSLDRSPWWPILVGTPSVRAVLVCRRVPSRHPRAVLRRLRRNVVKHGLIFLPYRLCVFVWELLQWLVASLDGPPRPLPCGNVECELLETHDIHAPDVLRRVRQWRPDLGLSLGAPILRPCLFQIPTHGTANLHLGKVPEFRGAPPGFWELYTGATEIGATVHWIDEGLDTGPVIADAVAPVYATDTLERVEARATELGKRVLAVALHRLAAGTPGGIAQRPGGHTFRFPTLMQRAHLGWRLALRRLGSVFKPRIIVKGVAALTALALVRPLRDLVRTLRATHPVRVFTFHRISDLCRDGMTVSPMVFQRQIEYVKRHHDVMPLERALELLRAGAPLRRPVAVLTFDDGYRSVFERAWPAMTAAGVVGCCFVCTDFVGTDRRFPHDEENAARDQLGLMGWEELQTLREAGWTLGGHTATHPRLSLCTEQALRDQLTRPLVTLRERLGMTTVAMAYPFGGADDVPPGFSDVVRRVGYAACFSNHGGENFSPADCLDLRRIELGGDFASLAWKAHAHGFDLSRWRAWWDRIPPRWGRITPADGVRVA